MMPTFLTIIVGRTASGKDTKARLLCKNATKPLNVIKSYTTRPQRLGEGDTHIFISKDDAKRFPKKIAETTVNGYEYFLTPEQLESGGVCIVEPSGVDAIIEHLNPLGNIHIPIRLAYLFLDKAIRQQRYMKRDGSSVDDFLKREASESARFDEFEERLNDPAYQDKLNQHGVVALCMYHPNN